MEVCEEEPVTTFYLPYLVVLPLLVLIETVLLIQSWYQHCRREGIRSVHASSSSSSGAKYVSAFRNLTTALQYIALIYTLSLLFFHTIDPILNEGAGWVNTAGCFTIQTFIRVLPTIFYTLYGCLVILRIKNSFHGSYLAMSDCRFWTAVVGITVWNLAFCTWFNWLTMPDAPCKRVWNATDIHRTLSRCAFRPVDNIWIAIVFVLQNVLLVVQNIFFAGVFVSKLKKSQRIDSTASSRSTRDLAVTRLVRKTCLLTVFGTASSIICWALFAVTRADHWIALDMVMNCCATAFMFRYNERVYHMLCKMCIMCCFRTDETSKQLVEVQSSERQQSKSVSPSPGSP